MAPCATFRWSRTVSFPLKRDREAHIEFVYNIYVMKSIKTILVEKKHLRFYTRHGMHTDMFYAERRKNIVDKKRFGWFPLNMVSDGVLVLFLGRPIM